MTAILRFIAPTHAQTLRDRVDAALSSRAAAWTLFMVCYVAMLGVVFFGDAVRALPPGALR
jgi:hypothetical protein